MQESQRLDQQEEFPNKKINEETKKNNPIEEESISNGNTHLNEDRVLINNLNKNNIDKVDKKESLEDDKKDKLIPKLKLTKEKIITETNEIIKEKTHENKKLSAVDATIDKSSEINDKNIALPEDNKIKEQKEITKEKTTENSKLSVSDTKLEESSEIIDNSNDVSDKNNKLTSLFPNLDKSTSNIDKENKEIVKEKNQETNKKADLTVKSNLEKDKTKNNPKQIATPITAKPKTKPVKEPPIEKKPFLEFINDYLIPEIKNEFKLKGKEVNKINLQKTHRPIAEDICWVIYCEINDTCNFWLSFEKDDITSLKSFSLCKNYEKPSIIESFLIDEKKITLKLIISRILQRLNGQKLIGAN